MKWFIEQFIIIQFYIKSFLLKGAIQRVYNQLKYLISEQLFGLHGLTERESGYKSFAIKFILRLSSWYRFLT